MLMKPTVPDRRRGSKAYLALTGVGGPRSCNAMSSAAAVAERSFDPVNPEIGSLPINALAIALALGVGFSGLNLEDR